MNIIKNKNQTKQCGVSTIITDDRTMKTIITTIATIIALTSIMNAQTTSFGQYKDRMGFKIGGGAGFQSFPVLQLTDGSTDGFSFGGGTAVGFSYAHEFRKNFEVEVDLGGQFSQLDKPIENGSMEFSRTNLSISPYYMLPLGSKEKYRLKLGAGLDYIFAAQFDFDLSKIQGGIRDSWKYDNTVGEHLSVGLEINPGKKRFSIVPELVYQHAVYKFASGGVSYPTDSNMKTPDGSGLNMMVGVHYHFNWKKVKPVETH